MQLQWLFASLTEIVLVFHATRANTTSLSLTPLNVKEACAPCLVTCVLSFKFLLYGDI